MSRRKIKPGLLDRNHREIFWSDIKEILSIINVEWPVVWGRAFPLARVLSSEVADLSGRMHDGNQASEGHALYLLGASCSVQALL